MSDDDELRSAEERRRNETARALKHYRNAVEGIDYLYSTIRWLRDKITLLEAELRQARSDLASYERVEGD